MRSQIFRQIVSKRRRHTIVCQGVLMQYDGKSASRSATKAYAANCAVLPIYKQPAMGRESAVHSLCAKQRLNFLHMSFAFYYMPK